MRIFLFAGVLCILLSFIAIVTFVWLHMGTGGKIPFEYGIVMDAGSSHTEVLLYKWLTDKLNGTGVVEQQDNCATEEGIDDNGAQTNITVTGLMPCVAKLTEAILENENEVNDEINEQEIPVYMGATAGMRILNATEPAISRVIFLALENAVLRYKKGKNVLNVKTFRIIDGKEEALYAWITANYLSGLIPNLGRRIPEVKNISSLGIMDMGGASAQIAYEVKKEHLIHFQSDEIQTVKLYGHTFHVRGESNLCLGADEVMKRHRVLQIMAAAGTTKFQDPCYNDGAMVEVMGEDLDTVCTVPAPGSEKVFKPDQKYEFTGKFDERKCQQLLEDSLDPAKCKSKLNFCMMVEKHAPPPETVLYAVSNYFYSTAIFNLTQTTHDDFKNLRNEFCSKEFSDVQKMRLITKFAPHYCIKLQAIYAILTKIYLFESNHWSNIRFAGNINGQSLGWALGFMTHETNLIPSDDPSDSVINTTVFVIGLIVSLLLLAIGILLIIKYKRSGSEVVAGKQSSGKEQQALKDFNRNIR